MNIASQSNDGPMALSVAAARALGPALRARGEETSKLRHLPDATINDLESAHLFALPAPMIYGGKEASLHTQLDVTLELGAADGSVAWTYTLLCGGIWMAAALFSRETADAVFARGGPARVGAVMAPSRFRTRRVDGGLLIEDAQWAFNSGVRHAQWDIIMVPLLDEAGNRVDMAAALVPVSDVTILDDWDTIGLRGTGSVSVVARDLFVPESRLAYHSRVSTDQYPAAHLRDRPSFSLPVMPMLATKLAFPCLAVARDMVRQFAERARSRPIPLTTYPRQSEATVTHLLFGEASAKVDAAETILRRSITEMEAAATARHPLTREQRVRVWRDAAFAARLCWEAGDLLANASGGSFAREGSPMNRHWRDLRVATLHAGLSPATLFEIFGRVTFGLSSNSPLV